MKHKVQFVSLEETEHDLIVSFAVDDGDIGIKSLVLLRSLFHEEVFGEEERGVKVSMERDHFEQEDYNMLTSINIGDNEIVIESTFRDYQLDISRITKSVIQDMIKLLKKQNYDNRFSIHTA